MTPPHIEKAARELCKHFGDEPDERDGITLEWRRWHEYESIAGEICDIAIEEAAKVGERELPSLRAAFDALTAAGEEMSADRVSAMAGVLIKAVAAIRALAVEG